MNFTQFLEWTGFISGVLCVWWVVKEKIANWPMGLVNCAAWFVLFWQAHIYLNAGLQVLYGVISIYGWWHWVYGGEQKNDLPVRLATNLERLYGLIAIVVITIIGTQYMQSIKDVAPVWDTVTTIASIVAIYWQAKKIYESWILWLSVDIIYFFLYGGQHLYLTALTQVLFFAMCVVGIRDWRRSMNTRISSELEMVGEVK